MRELTTIKSMAISDRESKTISCIRTTAMLFIVLCHYMQALGYSVLGQLFTVGVPMFFMISGFLYGQKNVYSNGGICNWYKNRIVKIVLPIYIYYLLTGIIMMFLKNIGEIRIVEVICQLLNLQGFVKSGIGNIGTGPLWFITFILICYLITPLLQKLRERISVKKIFCIIGVLYCIEIIFIIMVKPFGSIINLVGVVNYIFAYYIGAFWNKRLTVKVYVLLSAVMAISIGLRLIFKEIADMSGGVAEEIYSKVIAGYSLTALALWIFFTIYKLCNIFNKCLDEIYPIVSCLDKKSFYVYIVHYAFLVGKLSVMNITDNIVLNTLIFILCTYIYASIIQWIYKKIFKLILNL